MVMRLVRKPWLIYPEDTFKVYWDLFITIVLLATCLLTPLRIAFAPKDEGSTMIFISYAIDFAFFIDMIIIFNTADYDDEYQIIEDKK